VPQWDAVIRLAARAAEGYDGDSRIHVAALFRAGRVAEALQRPWSQETRYTHMAWEWLFQGMLRLRAGRHEEARSILEQEFKGIDYLDQKMPRAPKSKIWSDWIYHVQCHVLRGEAEALLRAAGLRRAFPGAGVAALSRALWAARGDEHARSRRWKEAAADLGRALELAPDNLEDWRKYAALVANVGDAPAYRSHCAEMLRRFGAT